LRICWTIARESSPLSKTNVEVRMSKVLVGLVALVLMGCGTQFGGFGVYGSMNDKGRILIEIDPQVASCAALSVIGMGDIGYCDDSPLTP